LLAPQSVAADISTNPPTLYVADTGNNRVLAWKDPANAAKGAPADFVVGQRDFTTTLAQGPNSPNTELRINAGFSTPTAVAVDRSGNLYVADAGNNRILRFPRPVAQQNEIKLSDLVIGQRSVSSGGASNQNIGPTNRTLSLSPGTVYRVGLAFDSVGNLWVSDPGNNRVLRFPVAQLAPNTLEPTADLVLGQTDFGKSSINDHGEYAIEQGRAGAAVRHCVRFRQSSIYRRCSSARDDVAAAVQHGHVRQPCARHFQRSRPERPATG
jgi:sugar lactone lactonase YvrE